MKNLLSAEGYEYMEEKLTIRPYARLITMLGEQLIKNEKIALVELIKNSYDADASWVKISFVNFDNDYGITSTSKIIIEDDGCGMNTEILKKHWLNPATPDKLNRKKEKPTTDKGRYLQGEKGIGRFAIFKLGRTIKITTRRQSKDSHGKFISAGEDQENVLCYNFAQYDNDFLKKNGKEEELFLDNLEVSLSIDKPKVIVEKDVQIGYGTLKKRSPYGTVIEISDLNSNWSKSKIKQVQNDIGKLLPIFSQDELADFRVSIFKDNNKFEEGNTYKDTLLNFLEQNSVFQVKNGKYNTENNIIKFDLNNIPITLDYNSPEINGMAMFKDYYEKQIGEKKDYKDFKTECGDFSFEFYIFDFNITPENNLSKYYLSTEEKNKIKEHRIYLYRDGIRVMPYGDPDDDWLKIDMTRGTVSASSFLSNDQVVGCVYITSKDNAKLKDKTNREGLIEEGGALQDFIFILQLILKYIRKNPYDKYLIDKKKQIEINALKKGKPLALIESAKNKYSKNEDVQQFLKTFETSYKQENKILNDRITKTESLAAVGLSVETASHDVMLLLKRALGLQDALIKEIEYGDQIDRKALCDKLMQVRGSLSMVETQMRDIQLLFPSTKSRTKNINVRDIIDKVYNIYQQAFREKEIECIINQTHEPLVVKTTDAVLLQVLINLFDNALYWLQTINYKARKIEIDIDGNEQRLVFSDNGPGINETDKNYIFEAFYSGKGQEGRGLGLYIAKQLLDRYDYTINLAEFSKDMHLEGANFVLEFIREV